jgi:hypothetical protein
VNPTHIKLIRKALYQLREALETLNSLDEKVESGEIRIPESSIKLEEENINNLWIKEQLEFINTTAGDLLKVCTKMQEQTAEKPSIATN